MFAQSPSVFQSPPAAQSTPTFFPPPIAQPFEEEPDVIKEWRANQQETIKAREEAATKRHEHTVSQANQYIDDFYLEHKHKVEDSIKANKIEEQRLLDDLKSALGAGTTWSRIADLIELDNSQSKTTARTGPGTTDLTRFKEVLLRLKREGSSAPGAKGY